MKCGPRRNVPGKVPGRFNSWGHSDAIHQTIVFVFCDHRCEHKTQNRSEKRNRKEFGEKKNNKIKTNATNSDSWICVMDYMVGVECVILFVYSRMKVLAFKCKSLTCSVCFIIGVVIR